MVGSDRGLEGNGDQYGQLSSTPLNANSGVIGVDANIGKLAAGSHTVAVRIDAAQAIAEANETDNYFSRTITVLGLGPTVALPGAAVTFTENSAATILDATATVSDPDYADFNGGSLTVDFVGTSLAEDRLTIVHEGTGAGQIGVSGSSVSFGGAAIGTFAGGTNGATPLVVTLNTAAATPAAAQALLRRVAYQDVSDNLSAVSRSVRVVVNNGHAGNSIPVTKTVSVVPVNDQPTLDPISDPVAILED